MSKQTQRTAILPNVGGKIEIRETPIPTPDDDQLLVKITATAINPVDWKIQDEGHFTDLWPTILGTDAAGVVEGYGNKVTGFKKGERVFFQGRINIEHGRQGTFQEYTVVPAHLVSRIPANIKDEQAAGIALASMAGVVSIFVEGGREFPKAGPTATGQPIVILGGASSVGQYAIQLARKAGFSPIITTASLHNADLLKSLGASHVLDRKLSAKEVVSKIKALLDAESKTLDLIYDSISLADTQRLGIELLSQFPHVPNRKLILSLWVLPETEKAAKEEQPEGNSIYTVFAVGIGGLNQEVAVPFYEVIGGWLEKGDFVPNKIEVVGGLDALDEGFKRNKEGVSALKLIIKP